MPSTVLPIPPGIGLAARAPLAPVGCWRSRPFHRKQRCPECLRVLRGHRRCLASAHCSLLSGVSCCTSSKEQGGPASPGGKGRAGASPGMGEASNAAGQRRTTTGTGRAVRDQSSFLATEDPGAVLAPLLGQRSSALAGPRLRRGCPVLPSGALCVQGEQPGGLHQAAGRVGPWGARVGADPAKTPRTKHKGCSPMPTTGCPSAGLQGGRGEAQRRRRERRSVLWALPVQACAYKLSAASCCSPALVPRATRCP